MKIIILGGGFCGTLVARNLEKKLPDAEIILIDKKDYFEFSPSIHKVIFNSKYFNKITKCYKNLFNNIRIVKDKVVKVTSKQVITEKHRFDFDYLVICIGIEYPVLLNNTEKVCTLKNSIEAAKMGAKILASNKILIIGGGLIGTEIAGELVTKTKHKEITIVHNHNRLIERNPQRASDYALDFLTKRGARIIFNEKVIDHKDNKFITNKGRLIEADAGLWCAGIKANPYFMSGFRNIKNEKGFLKVNECLQLKGFKNIFVGGDINNVPEEKTAQNAVRHAHIISHNIISLINKTELKKHKPRSGPLVISLGDWKGILTFKDFSFCGFIPGIMKWLIEFWNLNIDYRARK